MFFRLPCRWSQAEQSVNMEPVFLGGHPAIDFLNTTLSPQGVTAEVIGDGESFLRWLAGARLLDAATAASIRHRYSTATLDAIAADARKLRGWLSGWIDRWSQRPRDTYATELRRLNALLKRSHSYPAVVQTEDSVKIVQRERILDPPELLALIALQVAQLIACEDSQLIRRCAGASCTLRFLDRTKAHRRIFCSAAACGNRAKVKAFRNRQRA
jgi:predicted RNA-binding Zn ribbon-like protein